jgi:hypothetical protein
MLRFNIPAEALGEAGDVFHLIEVDTPVADCGKRLLSSEFKIKSG